MNNLKNGHHGMRVCSGRLACFIILNSLFLSFLCGGQAMAAQTCKTTSITASTPTVDFVVNTGAAAGTVIHKKTGLMWKRCPEGQALNGATCTGTATAATWQAALQAVKILNAGGGFAGFTDWRVPDENELGSIVEWQCVTPSMNVTIFPATVINWYWSSSPFAGNPAYAWSVYFGSGNDSLDLKSKANGVRLVRGGQ